MLSGYRLSLLPVYAAFCAVLPAFVSLPVLAQQKQLIVVPMFESKTVFSGIGKTGDVRCSEYKPAPGNWQQAECNQLPEDLQGQDAALRMGTAVAPRFIDNRDGTVEDRLTGLTWLQDAFCSGISTGSNWADALKLIQELNQTGHMNNHDCGDTSLDGGHQSDWRLPNVRELQSIIDYGAYQSPYVNAQSHIQNLRSDRAYWSSTNYGSVFDADLGVNLLDDALRVNFGDAVTDGTGKNALQHVWAVRGGN